MAVSRDVRRVAFGLLVKRALTEARRRGMTLPNIEQATGVSKTTMYRWRDGNWTRDPRATEVKAFCRALGVPLDVAYRALGWTDDEQPEQPEPIDDPDLRALARRLQDPSVSVAERYHMRETIRSLVRRGDESPTRDQRTG